MRPVIIISSQYDRTTQRYFLREVYVPFLRRAGALPLVLPATDDPELIEKTLAMADGIMFPGGDDINPKCYGEEAIEACQVPTDDRDAGELALLAALDKRDMPVLGICRGVQMLNVFYGGTLYQDIPSQKEDSLLHWQSGEYTHSCHRIMPVPDTPLDALIGGETIAVNSMHHQGIKVLAPTLKSMATAPDGLVEAVYHPGKTFFWGIQWHPEYSACARIDTLIGKAFCDAACAYHQTKEG